jgi:DNA-binding protein YbaB
MAHNYDDPFFRDRMMRGDPREIMEIVERMYHQMKRMQEHIDKIELRMALQPNIVKFVETNYPEIIDQYETIQATKRKIGAIK